MSQHADQSIDLLSYDVIVVGSGTGMLAAITAADRGLRTLLVEKAPHLGGSTAMSGGGFWIPNNSILADHGARDSRERAGDYLDNLIGDVAPRERYQAYLDHGPAAVTMLRKYAPNRFVHMRDYPDYFTDIPGAAPSGRACESDAFDASVLGDDLKLLQPTSMESPVPMPITGADYRWINLMTRQPRGLLTAAKRVTQGVGGKLIRRHYLAGGQALAAGLIAGLRRAGVDIWTEAPLTGLRTDGGRVTGVTVRRDGRSVDVAASRGVILASGGFEHNLQLRQKFQSPALTEHWGLGSRANTGDVLEIAAAAGADMAFLDQAWWFPAIPNPAGGSPLAMLAERSLPGSIIVDGTGRRFFNESVNYMTAGQEILGQDDGGAPHLPMWLIIDTNHRNRYLLGTRAMPGMDLPRSWYDAGIAKKASTIAELATQLGLPELTSTVERFNLMAGQGKDDDFGRGDSMYDHYYGDPRQFPNPNLAPVEKAPFYAVKVVPGDLGTCGGVRADAYARALRADGSPIDGLYAIGNAAGNAFGTFYPGPGCTIGQGLVFGHVAALHAAGEAAAR
ncbi:FAD-binding protein [Mariniluteicoccus flavus]